ncbi:MAG: fused MFS/spermidine synthase [Planctomycetaceae bacterium]|nr:fused MFS/spermidine synthase [Planctomycetaceae bacterium]
MLLYCFSIFLGAFLLFLVQPMMAQFILPWFGGSSLVWTTCMLFFQSGLVLGYAYSHQLTQRLSPTRQWLLHLIVLALAVLFLPIRPGLEWKPEDGLYPNWRVLGLLAGTIGIPYVVLATTGPLIQRWQSLSHPQHSPYRLFALSNFGSLLALLGFPLVIESYLTLDEQSWYWSGGMVLYVLLVAACGYRFQRLGDSVAKGTDASDTARDAQPVSGADAVNSGTLRFGRWAVMLWLVLPMLASVQLLATTSFLTQEVGAHPFLWIVPLALYLISFIVCFEYEQLYIRPVFFVLLCGSALFACFVFDQGLHANFVWQILAYNGVLFSAAMICHGELARLKPDTSRLTAFYLCISVGGAAGGLLVALIAPYVFKDYYEFHLSLILIVILGLPFVFVDGYREYLSKKRDLMKLAGAWLSIVAGLGAAGGVGFAAIKMLKDNTSSTVVAQYRNEYGVLKVERRSDRFSLSHGKTMHGFQVNDPEWSHRPTSYYSPGCGLGLAMRFLQNDLGEEGEAGTEAGTPTETTLRIATIGLGTGTMVTWGRESDTVRFFEIDPKVVAVAQAHFTYLSKAKAKNDVVLGDARVQLERETENKEPLYDILVADAFSSDSIPKHLLTTEAMKVYLDRIRPDGFLAIHVSNRFIDLAPLLERQASDLAIPALYFSYTPNRDEPDQRFQDSSTWVILTKNEMFLAHPVVQSATRKFPRQETEIRWTDDFSPLLPLMKKEQFSTSEIFPSLFKGALPK